MILASLNSKSVYEVLKLNYCFQAIPLLSRQRKALLRNKMPWVMIIMLKKLVMAQHKLNIYNFLPYEASMATLEVLLPKQYLITDRISGKVYTESEFKSLINAKGRDMIFNT